MENIFTIKEAKSKEEIYESLNGQKVECLYLKYSNGSENEKSDKTVFLFGVKHESGDIDILDMIVKENDNE